MTVERPRRSAGSAAVPAGTSHMTAAERTPVIGSMISGIPQSSVRVTMEFGGMVECSEGARVVSCEVEGVVHRVPAGLAVGEPERGCHCALGEECARGGAMGELEDFAWSAESDGVLADDVAGADREDLIVAQWCAAFAERVGEALCCATWGIFFFRVVDIEDGGIEAVQSAGGLTEHSREDGDADRRVGRDENGDMVRYGSERVECCNRQACGADEERGVGVAGDVEACERAVFGREIDDNIDGTRWDCAAIVRDRAVSRGDAVACDGVDDDGACVGGERFGDESSHASLRAAERQALWCVRVARAGVSRCG